MEIKKFLTNLETNLETNRLEKKLINYLLSLKEENILEKMKNIIKNRVAELPFLNEENIYNFFYQYHELIEDKLSKEVKKYGISMNMLVGEVSNITDFICKITYYSIQLIVMEWIKQFEQIEKNLP